MGRVVCQIHGRAPFIETCPHVAAQVDAGKPPRGHCLAIVGPLWVCDDCLALHGLEAFVGLSDLTVEQLCEVGDMQTEHLDRFSAAYAAMEGRRLFCANCVAELAGESPPI